MTRCSASVAATSTRLVPSEQAGCCSTSRAASRRATSFPNSPPARKPQWWKKGVDFVAVDGGLAHLFFVLGLKYEELHLPWLTKLSHMLAHREAVEALLAAPDGAAIYDSLAEAERKLHARAAVVQ